MNEIGHRQRILDLAHEQPIFRTRDVADQGIPTMPLTRMVRAGDLERLGHGLYRLAAADLSEHASLAEVAARVPNGIICLLSALAFHELGDQLPSAVWLALPANTRPPRIDTPRLAIVWMSEASFDTGYERHTIDGVEVRITDPHKTIADLFKYRSRVGLDVALEGLREYWHSPRRDLAKLRRHAVIDRVQRVLQPYLEMLAA